MGSETGIERRKIREQYRELINLTGENKDSSLNTTDNLKKILKTANNLHETVTKPREHAKDTELLFTLAENGLSVAKRSFGSRLNTPKDLINALKCEYLPGWSPDDASNDQHLEDFGWDAMAEWGSEKFNTVCGMTTMFGPFQDLLPKEPRKMAQRRRREPLGALVKPLEQKNAEECCAEKQETDKNMEEMFVVLLEASNAERGVGFPQLVHNPKSFSQTVENIFTLSFLVKDGRVKMEPNPSGKGLLVTAMQKLQNGNSENNNNLANSLGKAQWISTFNMRDWRKLNETIPADKCLMKHRTYDDLLNEVPATPSPNVTSGRKRGHLLAIPHSNARKSSKRLAF